MGAEYSQGLNSISNGASKKRTKFLPPCWAISSLCPSPDVVLSSIRNTTSFESGRHRWRWRRCRGPCRSARKGAQQAVLPLELPEGATHRQKRCSCLFTVWGLRSQNMQTTSYSAGTAKSAITGLCERKFRNTMYIHPKPSS